MIRRALIVAIVLLATVALTAQDSRSKAQPRATEGSGASVSALRTSGASPAPAVRATMTEKIKDLASNDPVRIAAAAYWLGGLGQDAASTVPQLTAVLADSRHVDPARYRKHLAARSTRPESSSPGQEAAAALAKIGEPAVEALINVLKASPNPIARQNAAWALGIIQGRHSTGAVAAAEITTGTEN